MRDVSKNKKTIETYYDEELRYLDEAGREFARDHPLRASFLKIEQLDDRDPYVERLFEGFAFLTGAIRKKLDDELPELTQSLLGLLWPHFLRPIPSLSILEFQPLSGRVQEPHIIDSETEVASQPVRNSQICHFRTCYDVHIRPIRLVEAVLEDKDAIRFKFDIDESVDYSSLFNLDLGSEYQKRCRESLRLFIHEVDQPTARMLYLYLNHYVREVIISSTSDSSGDTNQVGGRIEPVGFLPEEGLLPYTDYSFSGYRLLQEYFAYPRKFFFFDISGFRQLRPPGDSRSLEVKVLFTKPFPADRRFARDNFRLHCTPIVNLSEPGALPINVEHEATEYKVKTVEGYEVYSVDSVVGTVVGSGERRTYIPFYSFKHNLSDDDAKRTGRYYNTTIRPGTHSDRDGRIEEYQDTYISVFTPNLDAEELREEALSFQVTCTNGVMAREPKAGEICNITSNSRVPEFVRFVNLTQPTLILYPPLQEGIEWRFISHLALNYLSLTDAEALRSILGLYSWSKQRGAREANERHISSVVNVSASPREIPYRGSVIRGMEITLEILKDNFEDEGEIYLFGSVMKEFLELYASINSFVQLRLMSYQTKEELFGWPPKVMNDRNRGSLMRQRHLPL